MFDECFEKFVFLVDMGLGCFYIGEDVGRIIEYVVFEFYVVIEVDIVLNFVIVFDIYCWVDDYILINYDVMFKIVV